MNQFPRSQSLIYPGEAEDSESPSSSLALTEQVRVLSLLGDAGLMATALIAGSVLDTVRDEECFRACSVICGNSDRDGLPLSK